MKRVSNENRTQRRIASVSQRLQRRRDFLTRFLEAEQQLLSVRHVGNLPGQTCSDFRAETSRTQLEQSKARSQPAEPPCECNAPLSQFSKHAIVRETPSIHLFNPSFGSVSSRNPGTTEHCLEHADESSGPSEMCTDSGRKVIDTIDLTDDNTCITNRFDGTSISNDMSRTAPQDISPYAKSESSLSFPRNRPAPTNKSIHPKWEEFLETVFKCTDDDVVTRTAERNSPIRGSSFKRLESDRWFDDEIVNGFGGLINVRSRQFLSTTSPPENKCIRRTYMFSSFFFAKLCQSRKGFNYEGVQRWTDRMGIDVSVYDLLLFPVLISNNHWVICAADMEEREVLYLDSINDADRSKVITRIKKWLHMEIEQKKGEACSQEMNVRSWVERTNMYKVSGPRNGISMRTMPTQLDDSSCGVFALQVADCLSLGIPTTFGQGDVQFLRKKIAINLIRRYLPCTATE